MKQKILTLVLGIMSASAWSYTVSCRVVEKLPRVEAEGGNLDFTITGRDERDENIQFGWAINVNRRFTPNTTLNCKKTYMFKDHESILLFCGTKTEETYLAINIQTQAGSLSNLPSRIISDVGIGDYLPSEQDVLARCSIF